MPDVEKLRSTILETFPDHPNVDVELVPELLEQETHVVIDDSPLLARLTTVVSRPIRSKCSTRFTAVHHSGSRPLSVISCGIWHCTQSSTAIAAASWFANLASAGSAHRCMDDNICFKTLDFDKVPWAAPGMNYYGIHYEMAGYDSWTNHVWLDKHEVTLKRTCFKTAQDSLRFKFPIKWLSVSELRNGNRSGITDHWAVSHAFGLSAHHDPRDSYDSESWGYPRDYMMELTRYYRRKLNS